MKKPKTWPERIRAIIDKHGMTQVAFANEMRVHESAVSLWLSGRREPANTAKRILEMIESGRIGIDSEKARR